MQLLYFVLSTIGFTPIYAVINQYASLEDCNGDLNKLNDQEPQIIKPEADTKAIFTDKTLLPGKLLPGSGEVCTDPSNCQCAGLFEPELPKDQCVELASTVPILTDCFIHVDLP
jgi:hypothetical protein